MAIPPIEDAAEMTRSILDQVERVFSSREVRLNTTFAEREVLNSAKNLIRVVAEELENRAREVDER